MPFATVKIQPGVKVEQTPTLLSANIVASQNIRWRGGLPEKIGGWVQFYANTIVGIVGSLWPWADVDSVNHLAVASDVKLEVITNGVALDITPKEFVTGATSIVTTMGSNVVTITSGSLTTINQQDAVVFNQPVTIDGIILSGAYHPATIISSDSYTILANAVGAAGSSTYAVATYTSVAGSNVVTVIFANHGLSTGGIWAAAAGPTMPAGPIHGFYTVTVIDANSFTIITPVQPSSFGPASAALALTYYGNSVSSGSAPVLGTSWTLGNFGSLLIASPSNASFGSGLGGPLFVWNPIGNFTIATLIVNAPIACTGFFIAMPQEQIVAYGAASLGIQDPMIVSWSDAGIFNSWIPSASNQAGNYRLTRGSAIIGGIQGPQQAMLFTDVGCWLMQYVGYPDIYGFFEIAQGCGLIAQFAVTTVGSVVYWMGRSGFWMYSNGAVQPLPCEVWDTVFPTPIDRTKTQNIRIAANTAYNEVAWYFTSGSSPDGENDKYVRFNVLTGEWDFGSLEVFAWVDDNIFGNTFSAMPDPDNGGNSLIMHMDQTNNANGAAISWSYTTGFFTLTEGEDKVFVDLVIPDFKWKRYNQPDNVSETINFTLFTSEYPDPAAGSGVATYGPYAVTSSTGAFEPRARGRYFSAQISGNDLGKWSRLGGIKFRYGPDGRN